MILSIEKIFFDGANNPTYIELSLPSGSKLFDATAQGTGNLVFWYLNTESPLKEAVKICVATKEAKVPELNFKYLSRVWLYKKWFQIFRVV